MPLYDNMEKYGSARQAIDDNMVHELTCWIPKATNTHLEHVTLIAFPLQHWLHTQALMLHYTYTASLVPCNVTLYVHCQSCPM
jgi:hypothetical protein